MAENVYKDNPRNNAKRIGEFDPKGYIDLKFFPLYFVNLMMWIAKEVYVYWVRVAAQREWH